MIYLLIITLAFGILIGSALGYYSAEKDRGEKPQAENKRGDEFAKGYVVANLMNQNKQNFHF